MEKPRQLRSQIVNVSSLALHVQRVLCSQYWDEYFDLIAAQAENPVGLRPRDISYLMRWLNSYIVCNLQRSIKISANRNISSPKSA